MSEYEFIFKKVANAVMTFGLYFFFFAISFLPESPAALKHDHQLF